MNYLTSFLEAAGARSKSADTYPEVPTKPTKPGFVGSVGSRDHTRVENDVAKSTPPKITDTYPEVPTKPTEPPPPDNAWRFFVADWPVPHRQRWADIAERHQVEGRGWREAEWAA